MKFSVLVDGTAAGSVQNDVSHTLNYGNPDNQRMLVTGAVLNITLLPPPLIGCQLFLK
jgi:hypothetical protein